MPLPAERTFNELAEIRKTLRLALRNDNINTVHTKSIREHSGLRYVGLILQKVRPWLCADIGIASPNEFESLGHRIGAHQRGSGGKHFWRYVRCWPEQSLRLQRKAGNPRPSGCNGTTRS